MRDTSQPASPGAVLCLLVSLLGCTSFEVIEPNVCGNKVREKDNNEDCDFHPVRGLECRAPSEPGACHLDCSPKPDGTLVQCPDGMGCTADGICRRPNGLFEPSVKLAPSVSSWLSTADFDGDGRRDIISTEAASELSQARFRIHYFGSDSLPTATHTFPLVVSRPLARQLVGGDDAEDLLFTNNLIGMLPGRADRDWVPASFSSYVVSGTRMRAVPVRPAGVGEGIGIAIFSTLEQRTGLFVPAGEDGALVRTARLSRPLEELAAQPVAAQLVSGPDSPCAEVVFAFLGDDVVHVLDLCELGVDIAGDEVLWRTEAREQVVRLPAGEQVSSAPLVADVDGDGHLDILVGSRGLSFVAHGDGTALEPEAAPLFIVDQNDKSTAQVPTPLAMGDLSGDGVVDFVLAIGIRMSHQSRIDGQMRYVTSYDNFSKPWTMAAVTDLNGNGLLDVIAGTEGEPGLSFLSGSDSPTAVYSRFDTQGPVQALTTGDFDGDRITDVAYVQSGPPNSDSDALAVAFGTRDGVPLPGLPIAGVSRTQQLGRVDQEDLDSVFVISHDAVSREQRSKFTLFRGNPDRLPVAPYSLVTFVEDGGLHDWNARALAAGAFTAPGANDVLALAGDDTNALLWSMWIVPDIGGGNEPPRFLTPDTVPQDAYAVTFNQEGGQLSAAALAADLDGDGLDEALVLMQKGLPSQGCYLLVYDVDIDGDVSVARARSVTTFDEPCRSPELSQADLDADGALDLLVLIGDPLLGPRKLRLLFNDGSGALPLKDNLLLSVAQHDIRGFSVFGSPPLGRNRDPQATRIAFITDDGLYVASNQPRGRKFDSVRLQGFNDATSVVVTDPSGDRVEDIAVADATGLWLVAARLE